MSHAYSTMLFLKKVSNSLLKQYFTTKTSWVGFNFDGLGEDEKDAIILRWGKMPAEESQECEIEFRDIYALSNDKGLNAILSESKRPQNREIHAHDNKLEDHFKNMPCFEDKAMWTFLNRKDYWEGIQLHFLAHSIKKKRFSTPKHIQPKGQLELTNIPLLEDAISEFYLNTQLRGENCVTYRYQWNEEDEYFFCFPQDYAQKNLEWINGKCSPTVQSPAFEIIFRYNAKQSRLTICAYGGAKIINRMKEIFASTMLSISELEDMPDIKEKAFALDKFKDRIFEFQIEPDSEVDYLEIKRMTIRPFIGRKHSIKIESYQGHSPFEIYKSLNDILFGLGRNRKSGTPDYIITNVDIVAYYKAETGKRPRTKTFTLSVYSHTLGSSLQEKKLEGILRNSGLELLPQGDE